MILYLKTTSRVALIDALTAAGMIVWDFVRGGEVISSHDTDTEAFDAKEEREIEWGFAPGAVVPRFKPSHPGDALVDIGTIYTGTGQYIEVEGMQVEQQVAIEGYHANLMLHGDVPEALETMSIKPKHAKEVFAGHNE
jgi:hypothetical protein